MLQIENIDKLKNQDDSTIIEWMQKLLTIIIIMISRTAAIRQIIGFTRQWIVY